MITPWIQSVREAAQGRHWPVRLLFWCWFPWLLVQSLRDPGYQGLLGGLNLGIHEFGHLVCMPLGEFVGVAGGSLVQCLVPVISFVMFHKQRDYFAFAFSFVWLGTNLCGVAHYMADARALKLPLVSPFGGGEVIHDWNYLLHKMNLLTHDTALAGAARGIGILCMLCGVLWGAWILRLMISAPRREIGAAWQVRDLES